MGSRTSKHYKWPTKKAGAFPSSLATYDRQLSSHIEQQLEAIQSQLDSDAVACIGSILWYIY